MIDNIIFSKDRACQLDLLLRSIIEYYDKYQEQNFYVIYKHSDDDYKTGYDALIAKYTWVNWIKESDSFKSDLCNINLANEYTTFFVDDNVFKHPFSIDDEEFTAFIKSKNILCLSLMLGKNIKWAYELLRKVIQPECNVWKWRDADIDFNYPMSVCGHVFRRNEIINIIADADYNNPNSFEDALVRNPPDCEYMVCYNESRIVEICVNSVSDVINKHGKITAKALNNRFLDGQQIVIENINNDSVHYEHWYNYEKII